jgi:hypothetical protein
MDECSIIFAPGTWTVAPAARAVRFWITSSGRFVVHGSVIIRHGGLVLRKLRAASTVATTG